MSVSPSLAEGAAGCDDVAGFFGLSLPEWLYGCRSGNWWRCWLRHVSNDLRQKGRLLFCLVQICGAVDGAGENVGYMPLFFLDGEW